MEKEDVRICSECGKEMYDGYCIADVAYYCSDECLYKNCSEEDYIEMYENGNAYYTDWYYLKEEEKDLA